MNSMRNNRQQAATTIPEKGHMAPHFTPCFPGDPIYNDGCRAWAGMKGYNDCPYVGDTSGMANGWDFWETGEGKRQRWFAGYNDTSCRAEKIGTLETIRRVLG